MRKYFIMLAIIMPLLLSGGRVLAAVDGCCAKSSCACVKGGCCINGKCACKGDCCSKGSCHCADGKCSTKCNCQK
jgi:hypothetical protein